MTSLRNIALAIMLAFPLMAGATQGGEGGNTDCNGQGNPNSPCTPSGNGGSGGGGSTGGTGVGVGVGIGIAGASANNKTTVNTKVGVTNVNRNTVSGGTATSNSNATGGSSTATGIGGTASSNATGGAGGAAYGGHQQQSANIGDVTTSATGGNQSQSATASTDGNTQILNVGGNVTNNPSDIKVLNTPDAYAPIANPSAPCRVAHSGGGSGPGFGVSFGSSSLDEGCDTREDARLLYNMGMRLEAVKRLCAKPEMQVALGDSVCPKPAVVATQTEVTVKP